ncbi:flagellar biosynthetic protein FliO [Sinorhizobium medicae]|uniref:flagellar biosynthetic protein FliO n=1 Tax=Sinorhizobium medicae TaxID=110321 RepID=UPI002AF6B0A5|nr:flagellar biosynthetic protein FliO [Sinorhizobium medicae]WQO43853.1 flagellar biosynthetic protein FliO [Sinorhizobium medicae]WQO71004.1 flagellar biosynthetic protein FliO [Sinorhizobium medicae]
MMETILGDNTSRFMIAAGAVAIGLLCLAAVLWLIRNKPSSPFVRGGKNRQPRLAVLDAAAVDTRRRLVLVRRDDVEHLIMIGGPTDIVIESRIAPEQESPGPANLQSKPEEKAAPAPIAEARPQSVSSPLPTRTPLPAEAAVETVRQSAQTNESPRVAARAEPSTRSVPDPQAPVQGPSSPLQVSRPSPAPQIPPLSVAVEPSHADFGALRGQALPLEPPTRNERTVPLAAVEPVRPAIEPVKAMPDLPLPPRRAEPEAAAEFERMLDAEISGDLQRLAPTAQPRPEIRPAAAGRQEPILGSPLQDSRKEPTIEEEMERMLSDISAGRKL